MFIRLLSRSALGSPITQYTSHFRAPRRRRRDCTSCWSTTAGPSASACEDFWHSLKCIRCGACMNTCPVYRRSGGLSYGATYSGPIGVILDPDLQPAQIQQSLPFASTLCGSCTSVCPVKIDIHEQIYKWRQVIAERHQLPLVKKEAMRVAGKVLAEPEALSRRRRGRRPRASSICRASSSTTAFNAWGRQREVPAAPATTFRQWYLENRGAVR